MTTKLSPNERKEFMNIFKSDFQSIQSAITKQIETIWNQARDEILKRKGYDKLIEKKELLEEQQKRLLNEIHQIEQKIRPQDLTKQQIIELGGATDTWGKGTGARFYGIPITSQFEYEIIQLIKENINLEAPAKYVYDLHRACLRELTMVGTFGEAQQVYERFYKLNFRKYGIDIPPRLAEIKPASPLLESKSDVLQIEDQKDETEEIKGGI